jgi:phage terminase large subunit
LKKLKKGLNIRKCKKGAGSVKDGIALMKDYQLIVDYKSLNLVEELNNYSWRKDGEEPIDRYQHLLDAARYIITDRLKEQSGVYYIY